MTRRIGVLLLAALAFGFPFTPRAARAAEDDHGRKRDVKPGEPDAKPEGKADDKSADPAAAAVVDKAVEALGGREKLRAVKAATWQTRGKINLDGNDNDFTSAVTVCGLRQFRQEFEVTVNGEAVKGATVLNGDQGWRKLNDDNHELDKDAVAAERRNVYLQVVAADPLVLESSAFKVESAGEEKAGDKAADKSGDKPGDKAGDKPAAVLKVLKVTGPDGKEFTMYFDKQSGLPVRQVAKVTGWDGEEYTQDVTFSDYKEFAGVKKATRIAMKKDGEKFISYEVTHFEPLTEKVPAEKFGEPK